MTKEEILKEIEEIKAKIKELACCVNTDDLSDRAAYLHKELRRIEGTA